MNSLYSLSDAKYIYIFVLNFSDLSISESSFSLIFDMFKDIDIKTFSKSIENSIYSVIAMLYSIPVMLTFF